MSRKKKLSIYQLICIPDLTYGHKLRLMTEEWYLITEQAAKIRILPVPLCCYSVSVSLGEELWTEIIR